LQVARQCGASAGNQADKTVQRRVAGVARLWHKRGRRFCNPLCGEAGLMKLPLTAMEPQCV
jgi:hypothetical protein